MATFGNVLRGVESSLTRLISGGELNDDIEKSLREKRVDGYQSPDDSMSPWIKETDELESNNRGNYGGLKQSTAPQTATSFMSAGLGAVGSPKSDDIERANFENWIYNGDQKLRL